MSIRRLLLLVTLVASLAACAPGEGSGGTLDGTDWVLRSYLVDGALTIAPETEYASAEFRDRRISGFSGCNTYDGLYRTGTRTLLVSNVATTLMACDEATMAFESAFLTLLEQSRFYSARRSTLTIFDGDRREILVFDAAPRNPLLGTWDVDSFATAPNSIVAPIEGTELEIVFGIASVGGFAGCNSFSGTYGTNGNVVRISRLATTRLACDQAIMDQEAAFLTALEGAALVESRGTTILLTDVSGSINVALARPEPVVAPSPAVSPQPSARSSATPTATATASPTPSPTPTPAPTPTPTAAPTATPTTAPTPVPPSIAPTASCDLLVDGSKVATIAYPGAWSTLTTPADMACRYFDPDPITVPDDPTTLLTAVMVPTTPQAYADVVGAATDQATWDVIQQVPIELDGAAATLVGATALTDVGPIPSGSTSFAYLVDLGAAGTLAIRTTGTPGDDGYEARAAVVNLMAELSTFDGAD
jgi:heat shock protein HslJ